MPKATVRANARSLPEASEAKYQLLKADFAALELPIYDVMRLLRAAAYLHDKGDEDLCSSASLIIDLAFQKADELNEQYQKSFPGEGTNSRIEEDGPTAKTFILRELDACERRLRETRTQAEAISEEGTR
jgi:hypothetical protein